MTAARWICALSCLLLAGYGYADVTAYQGATLIDGTHRGAVENATVLVEGDRFVAAGTDVAVPEGANVVDVSGKWIVPGADRFTRPLHDLGGACTRGRPLSI